MAKFDFQKDPDLWYEIYGEKRGKEHPVYSRKEWPEEKKKHAVAGKTGLTLAQIKQVKELFFQGHTPQEIRDVTGFKLPVIKKLILNPNRPGRNWAVQREEISAVRAEVLVQSLVNDAIELRAVLKLGTKAIKSFLVDLNENIAKGDKKLGVKDAKLLSDLIANVHRVESLELNKPTEVVKYDYSPEQIRALIPKVIGELQNIDPGISYLPEQTIEVTQVIESKDGEPS